MVFHLIIKRRGKMKKIILAAAMLIFGMAGSASALGMVEIDSDRSFSDSVYLPSGYGNDLITWTHDAPFFFEAHNHTIDLATIEITYSFIDTKEGEEVWLNGSYIGQLGVNGNNGRDLDTAIFDVTANLDPFNNKSILNLSLKIDETGDGWGNDYWLVTSTFYLYYSRYIDDNNNAPVPEPGTILLVGLGLAGLVGYSRKRSSKKA
jgi:hypothetical protein